MGKEDYTIKMNKKEYEIYKRDKFIMYFLKYKHFEEFDELTKREFDMLIMRFQ